MTGASVLARRARDPRPPSISFPVSANRNASMSDAHEVLQALREIPTSLLSYEGRSSLHILSARTDAGLYEPDVVVELVHREGILTFEPEALRIMIVRTLEAAFPENGCSVAPAIDQKALMASLGALTGMMANDVETVDGLSAICSAPSPWSDMDVRLLRPTPSSPTPALSQSRREAWSSILRPAIRITDRTQSDARLAISMRPDSVTAPVSTCPMERLRLERDLAPVLAGVDDEAVR